MFVTTCPIQHNSVTFDDSVFYRQSKCPKHTNKTSDYFILVNKKRRIKPFYLGYLLQSRWHFKGVAGGLKCYLLLCTKAIWCYCLFCDKTSSKIQNNHKKHKYNMLYVFPMLSCWGSELHTGWYVSQVVLRRMTLLWFIPSPISSLTLTSRGNTQNARCSQPGNRTKLRKAPWGRLEYHPGNMWHYPHQSVTPSITGVSNSSKKLGRTDGRYRKGHVCQPFDLLLTRFASSVFVGFRQCNRW